MKSQQPIGCVDLVLHTLHMDGSFVVWVSARSGSLPVTFRGSATMSPCFPCSMSVGNVRCSRSPHIAGVCTAKHNNFMESEICIHISGVMAVSDSPERRGWIWKSMRWRYGPCRRKYCILASYNISDCGNIWVFLCSDYVRSHRQAQQSNPLFHSWPEP